MHDPIWKKKGIEIDPDVMAYLAGEDVILDRELLPFDIQGTRAHVKGLGRIGILSDEEVASICASLKELSSRFDEGQFELDERFEDCHSAIEWFVTDQLGELGGKIHTGRSRNDQILTAMRLWQKDRLSQLSAALTVIAEVFANKAEEFADTPMPGYTHLQRAVPTTLGLWHGAFAEALSDDAALAKATSQWIDANPLGTAAGYGVSLPLDRDFTTTELGFGRIQQNPIYAQNSRGKFELQGMMAMAQAQLTLRRLAWDLSLFACQEFAFMTLPARYTTGSSIMPNKRNPDLIELMRAQCAEVQGAMVEMQSLLSLPSGYHRDLQGSKPPLLRVFGRPLAALKLLPGLIMELSWNPERMAASIDDDMHSTERALKAAAEGKSFRQAYQDAAPKRDE